jgi:general secretion pathway protein G
LELLWCLVFGVWSFNRLLRRGEREKTAASSLPQKSGGFTLIEIMVVVIVIGILAATIIPQFMGTTHDAKVSSAKANIAELESALERFNVHTDHYPSTEEGLKVLVEAPAGDQKRWRGPYIKMLRSDPWGNPYQYRRPGAHHPTSFDLWSRGADGADGGEAEAVDIGNW